MTDHDEPALTLGIEEEYFLVDRETGALAAAPEALIEACAADLGGRADHEFLQCQIEVGTGVCPRVADARRDLRRLRATVARRAAEHGLAPIASASHPFGDWVEQEHVHTPRYEEQVERMGGVARRTLVGGMHVHLGVEDPDARVALMSGMTGHLPLMLALSTSSPFWRGRDSGLASYRLSVFDAMPRTGTPPRFGSWAEYEGAVRSLVGLGAIDDASRIYWDLRPNHAFPTVETRIFDACPRMEDALSLAALAQALARRLWRLGRAGLVPRPVAAYLQAEARWRAQRSGVAGGLVDLARGTIRPAPEMVDALVDELAEDAEALGTAAELDRLRGLAREGSSADRQRAVHARALGDEAAPAEALRAVAAHLVEEFAADLGREAPA